MLTYIRLDNFKSLKDVEVYLPPFSVFCGPNASGKSNFAEALDFLSNTFQNGLSYAVAEKGGFYNICFRKRRRARGAISFVLRGYSSDPKDKGRNLSYEIAFSLRTKEEAIRSDFFVETEKYHFSFQEPSQPTIACTIERKQGSYLFTLTGNTVSENLNPQFLWLKEAPRIFSEFIKPRPTELIYPSQIQGFFPYHSAISDPSGIRVFRINPRTARQAGTPSVLGELGKHGENLPSALDRIATHEPATFERLQTLVRDVVPSLAFLEADYTETKQMGLFLQEKGFGSPWYAEDLSDGTLMTIALFIGLLDSRHRVVLIEEPENSLHPWILRRFLQTCRDVSDHKQVLLTTQSPIVVSMTDPSTLFLVERKTDATEIVTAWQREPTVGQIVTKEFMDLGEYWLSGGMGAVPTPPADSAENSDSGDEE